MVKATGLPSMFQAERDERATTTQHRTCPSYQEAKTSESQSTIDRETHQMEQIIEHERKRLDA
jgi:hypothetical protein